jgi:hypothetical protein
LPNDSNENNTNNNAAYERVTNNSNIDSRSESSSSNKIKNITSIMIRTREHLASAVCKRMELERIKKKGLASVSLSNSIRNTTGNEEEEKAAEPEITNDDNNK